MDVKEFETFCCGQLELDVGTFLDALAAIDEADPSALKTLSPSPLVTAALHARRPSDISVARTYRGVAALEPTRLDSPQDHFLITLVVVDADLRLVSASERVLDGFAAAGTACVTGPGEWLEVFARSACDLIHLAVPSQVSNGAFAQRAELAETVLFDALLGRIGRLLGEAPAEWLRVYAELLSQLAVTRVLQLLPRPPASRLPTWRLKKVQSFVEANIAEPLRLEDLAAASGLSRMHFAAQFRAATGLRPHDYVLARRIEHAKRSITAGQPALVEVALDAGFQSQAHFCTIFKRLTGLTPSAWRRQESGVRWTPLGGPNLQGASCRPTAATGILRSFIHRPGLPQSDAHHA